VNSKEKYHPNKNTLNTEKRNRVMHVQFRFTCAENHISTVTRQFKKFVSLETAIFHSLVDSRGKTIK
jgi:hypothetical protein